MSQPYDAACDMWSLGVVAYELIALKPPFTARNIKELQQTVLAARYTPPPTSDAAIVAVIASLLQRQPSNRPSTANLLESAEVRIHRVSTVKRAPRISSSLSRQVVKRREEGWFEAGADPGDGRLEDEVRTRIPAASADHAERRNDNVAHARFTLRWTCLRRLK